MHGKGVHSRLRCTTCWYLVVQYIPGALLLSKTREAMIIALLLRRRQYGGVFCSLLNYDVLGPTSAASAGRRAVIAQMSRLEADRLPRTRTARLNGRFPW